MKRPITRLELAILLLLILAAVVYGTVTNAFTDLIEISSATAGNPASGNERWFGNSSTHTMDCHTSSGGSCAPMGGGGGFIQTLTAPVGASFSQENFTAGVSQVNNTTPVTSVTIFSTNNSNPVGYRYLAQAEIAATFTVTTAISFAGDPTSAPHVGGVILTDGTKLIVFGLRGESGQMLLEVQEWNTFNSFSGAPYSNADQFPAGFGPLIWLRVTEDATNRTYFLSSDGITFAAVYQEAVGTFLTTADYGFGLSNDWATAYSSYMMTCYSFTATNP